MCYICYLKPRPPYYIFLVSIGSLDVHCIMSISIISGDAVIYKIVVFLSPHAQTVSSGSEESQRKRSKCYQE